METLNFKCFFIVCMFLNHGIHGEAPTLDRWLSVFFRELNRNVSPEILKESVMKNRDKLVLIQIPQSIKATFPLGVRLGPCEQGDQGYSVAFATDITPSQSFSVACMSINGYEAQPLSGYTPAPKDTYEKSLALLLKLYPDIHVSLPFTPEEIRTFLKNQGYEDKKANDLEERILDIQSRDNYLSRSIPTLQNLYERASSLLQEEEEEAEEEDGTSSIFFTDDVNDIPNELDDDGFEDPFFSVDNWVESGEESDTFPQPRSNQNEEESDSINLEEDVGKDDERDSGEELGISNHEDEDNEEQFVLDTVTSLDSDYETEEMDEAPYKTKYETVLGILLTILAVVAIIVLIYIYRRQQRSRVFQVSGPSTPSSRASPNNHNIFEPQILQISKDDPEGSFITEENTATIKTGQLLAVKVASSRHSSVSSSRSNPFLGSETEIPKIPGPPTTPNTPTSRRSTNSFAPQY